ncbi:MAG: DUF3795 domain-containing protein [Treponema sp.]|nr:DUF3795 domain-containing protein [Treponema sp.]
MDNLIACCGLDCRKCDAYIATMNNDESLRKKTAELWSKLNGVEITPEMINCTGCRMDGPKTPFCASMCQIRQCTISKMFKTCGSCTSMESCEKLSMITGTNKEALNNLKAAK